MMWNYHGLGIALIELGRFREAEVAMRRALDLARTMGLCHRHPPDCPKRPGGSR